MGVGARDFSELVAWQRANDLKLRVYALVSQPRINRDIVFCAQIRDSAASATSNIAEGFGRFSHREFSRFLAIARGSLIETQNHLRDAADRGYVNERELAELWELSKAAVAATTALLRYLRGTPDRT